MSISIYRGEFCTSLPGLSEINTKFRIVHEKEFYESNIVNKSFNPKWNVQWNIPVKFPFHYTYIVVEIIHEG